MIKRLFLVPCMLFAGLLFMATYSFGGQPSPDASRYYAQEDESGSCCCKISDGEGDDEGSYSYQSASVDDCTASGGSCVADSFCRQ